MARWLCDGKAVFALHFMNDNSSIADLLAKTDMAQQKRYHFRQVTIKQLQPNGSKP